MKGLGPSQGQGAGLGLFFLRAAPVRAAGFISAIVAFILLAVFLTLQSFQLSGSQQADQSLGSSDYSLQTENTVRLGESGQRLDDSLRAAALQAGATNPIIRYSNFDGLTIEDKRATSVGLEEGNWEANPFPHRLFIEEGRWPHDFSEVTVSAALGENYPIGSTIKLFGGNWTLTVVGIVKDNFSRQASTIFVRTGSWNSLATIDPATAERYGRGAVRTFFWSAGDPDLVGKAVIAVLSSADAARPTDRLAHQIDSRSELTSRGSPPLIEFALGSLIAPFLASMVGIILAIRFIDRIRTVMLSVGIARDKTRFSALFAVTVSSAAGLAIGIGAGIAVGYGLRPIMDSLSERPIGPIHDLSAMVISILIASLLGGGLALLLNSARQTVGARVLISTNRAPRHYVILPILSVVLVTIGFFLAQASRNVDEIIIAGICFAFAGVALLPLALDLILLRDPQNMPALLAVRRLRAGTRQSGWITATVSALLVVAFATTTLITSSFTTMNESNHSTVPMGQIYFQPSDALPASAADTLASEIENYLGMQPVIFHIAGGLVDILDGGTIVVDSVSDFQTLTKVKLSNADRELLISGGTLRTKEPNFAKVTFDVDDGSTQVFRASVVKGLTASYSNLDGFILRSAAESNNISLVNETRAFLDPSSDQLARARNAAIKLGFNSDWLAAHKAPDVFSEPIQSRIAAGTIALLAVVIMIFYVLAVTRLLRTNLSTLRAIGAGRRWLFGVLLTQISTVLVVAVLGAVVSAVLGMFTTIRISGLDLKLIVPGQSIGITIVTLVIGTIIATFAGSRRLTNGERFTSTQ